MGPRVCLKSRTETACMIAKLCPLRSGGFVAGILAGIVFLPSMHIGKWNIKRRILQVAITFPLLIGSIVALFVVFYMVDQDVNEWCPNCKYVTCLPVRCQIISQYYLCFFLTRPTEQDI